MTDSMLELARRSQAEAGVSNVHWLLGHIENIPLPSDSVDVIISNCVINLSGDGPRVFREAARVLKPGGRFVLSDVVADPGMDEATKADMAQFTGSITGALTRHEFTSASRRPGRRHRNPAHPPRARGSCLPNCASSTPDPDCSRAAQATCCAPREAGCCNSEQTRSRTCGCS